MKPSESGSDTNKFAAKPNLVRTESDLDRLNNSQVVLIVILVAIVSAIASTIAVLQLRGDSPREVVRETVQTVREVVTEKEVPVSATSTVRNIVIREGDLVAKAIEQNQNTSVELYGNSVEPGTLTTRENLVGYGFIVSEHQLISAPNVIVNEQVTARDVSLSKRGENKIALWQSEEFINAGDPIELSSRIVRVGQTAVFISGSGTVKRGIISSLGDQTMRFSESLSGQAFGIVVDLEGNTIGVWNGTELVRGSVVRKAITDLSSRPFTPATDGQANSEQTSSEDKGVACAVLGGIYDDEFDECLDVTAQQCATLGGVYESCASPCRNDPDAKVCIQSCSVVCAL